MYLCKLQMCFLPPSWQKQISNTESPRNPEQRKEILNFYFGEKLPGSSHSILFEEKAWLLRFYSTTVARKTRGFLAGRCSWTHFCHKWFSCSYTAIFELWVLSTCSFSGPSITDTWEKGWMHTYTASLCINSLVFLSSIREVYYAKEDSSSCLR